jgi:cell division protein FtsZ
VDQKLYLKGRKMELVENLKARIKVVGVGGAGGNAINRMIMSGVDGVEFIAINTDNMALENSLADIKIPIGVKTTKGLGAGAKPEIAEESIHENRDQVEKAIEGADMVFITAGMGGGTGSGAAPVVAQICREKGILSVAVITKPFRFEGPKRKSNCEQAISKIESNVDTIITIANEKILGISDKKTSFKEAFAYCDGVLTDAVRGISDIILTHGEIQVDFADVKAIMSAGGHSLMGTGRAEGENRAVLAAERAITSPLLDEVNIAGASGILVNIAAGEGLGIHEINEAMEFIYEAVGEDNAPNIIFGVTEKLNLGEEVAITVIATGFKGAGREKSTPFLNNSNSEKPTEIRVDVSKSVKPEEKEWSELKKESNSVRFKDVDVDGFFNHDTSKDRVFNNPQELSKNLAHAIEGKALEFESKEQSATNSSSSKVFRNTDSLEENMAIPAFIRQRNK